ncbi:hypothetical protein X534_gp12 [Ralstonia phage RSB3]|uniref:Uncharacterized protein n=1 Tax=Ralstonia phage RSB3 TaxID=1402875 RepID=U3TK66_9CAUD|nr:hypothetical protein X534_gp12 [Ralstonia phage RSB3]BAN92323.1 hypothetical protein [Ralstonia phage RSB3]
MSKRLKATARLTSIGAAVSALFVKLGNAFHNATLELHDKAFTSKRKALAQKELALIKGKADTLERHFTNVSAISERFQAAVTLAQQEYDYELERLNQGTNLACRKLNGELSVVREEIDHYRAEHTAFRA